MKKLYFLFLVIFVAGCQSQVKETYQGHEVVQMPFKVAGGEVIYLPVTDAGAIPAKANGYEMAFAGFSVGASKTTAQQAELTWMFAFKSSNNYEIKSVSIEEIYTSSDVISVAEFTSPQINDGLWKSNLSPVVAGEATTPWLYGNKSAIFVFRISIIDDLGNKTVLTQPTWFSRPVLNNYVNQIRLINNG